MKIKVTKKAFYKNALLEEGIVINFPDKEPMPSWGTLASGEESGTEKDKADDNINVPNSPQTPDDNQGDEQTPNNENEEKNETTPDDDQCKTVEQFQAELDKLIDIAVANEVWVDVAPETSIPEQISLFKEALNEKGIELH